MVGHLRVQTDGLALFGGRTSVVQTDGLVLFGGGSSAGTD